MRAHFISRQPPGCQSHDPFPRPISGPGAFLFIECLVDEPFNIRYDIEITGISRRGPHMSDEQWMREALALAREAAADGEVPIGCVIVSDGRIIARGYNRRNTDKNTLSHAELNAIRKASKRLGDWRLEGCTMYVTLEPCQMCAGALVQSRIDEVVIGSMNPKAGCAGSVLNLLEVEGFNHKVKITRGVLEEECSAMLSDFFRELREKKKRLKMLARQQAQEAVDGDR